MADNIQEKIDAHVRAALEGQPFAGLALAQNELKNHFSVGYSWFMVEMPGKRPFVGHNGGMVGFASAFIHFRAEKLTAVALYNTDTVAQPHEICQEIVEIYLTQ